MLRTQAQQLRIKRRQRAEAEGRLAAVSVDYDDHHKHSRYLILNAGHQCELASGGGLVEEALTDREQRGLVFFPAEERPHLADVVHDGPRGLDFVATYRVPEVLGGRVNLRGGAYARRTSLISSCSISAYWSSWSRRWSRIRTFVRRAVVAALSAELLELEILIGPGRLQQAEAGGGGEAVADESQAAARPILTLGLFLEPAAGPGAPNTPKSLKNNSSPFPLVA